MQERKTYRTTGQIGEGIVVKMLRDRGFCIVARNFRFKRLGEIDIFASKDNCLYSIEVKTFINTNPFLYQDKIDSAKISRVVRLSEIYMKQVLCNKVGNIRYYTAFVQIIAFSGSSRYRCTFVPM